MINTNPDLELFSLYIALLRSESKYEELLYYALKMQQSFPDDMSSFTIICKAYNQLYVEQHVLAEHFQRDAIRSFAKLLNIDSNNIVALLTKSALLYKDRNLLEARDTLVKGTFL